MHWNYPHNQEMPVSTRRTSHKKDITSPVSKVDTKPPLPKKKKQTSDKQKATGLTELEDAQLVVNIEHHPGFQWVDLLNQYPSRYRSLSKPRQTAFRNRFQYVKRVVKKRSITEWSDLYLTARKLVEECKDQVLEIVSEKDPESTYIVVCFLFYLSHTLLTSCLYCSASS